jgi:hypothetical protein
MHRELEWPVSKATCLYTNLYMVYIHLCKIKEGTSATLELFFLGSCTARLGEAGRKGGTLSSRYNCHLEPAFLFPPSLLVAE